MNDAVEYVRSKMAPRFASASMFGVIGFGYPMKPRSARSVSTVMSSTLNARLVGGVVDASGTDALTAGGASTTGATKEAAGLGGDRGVGATIGARSERGPTVNEAQQQRDHDQAGHGAHERGAERPADVRL